MKKKYLTLALLAFFGVSIQAQDLSLQDQLDERTPKAGLKGMLEIGYAIGENIYSEVPISFMASVGWQCNPHLFIGCGTGENFFTDPGIYSIPFFGEIRTTILKGAISPFVDVRTGYSIADLKGFYFSPSIGCRFGSRINTALYISIGYELQRSDRETLINNGYKSTKTVGGASVKFGFDF